MSQDKKTYEYECFEDTISFAESLGFDADACEDEMTEGGEYTPDVADALEQAAIDHIRAAGYEVTGYDD